MKRAVEILAVALFLLVSPVLLAHPLIGQPWTDPLGGTALAVQPDEVLADPALEKRARAISAGLRCLVCQNQSIDDSDAGLARDLRLLVRERLKAGDGDAAVLDYVVARYGEFVLLKPRLELSTLLLWGTPVVLVLCGGLFVFLAGRRKARSGGGSTLTAEEEQAVERALQERGF